MSEENEVLYQVVAVKPIGKLRIKRYFHPELFLNLWRKQNVSGFTYRKDDILYIKLGLEVGGAGEIKEVPKSTVIFDVAEESIGITLNKTTISKQQVIVGEFIGDLNELIKAIGRSITLKRL